jgi:hypothetical protein
LRTVSHIILKRLRWQHKNGLTLRRGSNTICA